jgi:hypothetical protein
MGEQRKLLCEDNATDIWRDVFIAFSLYVCMYVCASDFFLACIILVLLQNGLSHENMIVAMKNIHASVGKRASY